MQYHRRNSRCSYWYFQVWWYKQASRYIQSDHSMNPLLYNYFSFYPIRVNGSCRGEYAVWDSWEAALENLAPLKSELVNLNVDPEIDDERGEDKLSYTRWETVEIGAIAYDKNRCWNSVTRKCWNTLSVADTLIAECSSIA